MSRSARIYGIERQNHASGWHDSDANRSTGQLANRIVGQKVQGRGAEFLIWPVDRLAS
jgi:hypothetical protein